MQMKIAVFGRQEWIDRMKSYISDRDEIEIIPFAFTKAKETIDLVEEAFMCDMYLFIGSLPYLYAKEKVEKKRLPTVRVAFDEYMILTSFYRVKNYHHKQLARLSIDVLNRQHVREVLAELNIKNRDIYTYSYSNDEVIDLDKIVAHHQRLWDAGKIDYVLTSIVEIQQRLKDRGIPTYGMKIPKRNMVQAIEKATSIIRLNQSKSAQIVAGYVRIKHFQALDELAAQEASLRLHQLLLQFAHKTYASVLPSGDNQFVLFGTRGTLDHITNHYRDFPLLQDIERTLKVSVEIGFGLGLTTKQAEDHAKSALHVCEKTENSSCYIVNERQDIIGPLGVEKHVDASRLYHSLIHKARLNNELSYNFIDFIKIRNNEPFSSADISTYYRVTKRSAERTINKLLAGEVIKAVGQEKPYVRGRPRKLFKISI